MPTRVEAGCQFFIGGLKILHGDPKLDLILDILKLNQCFLNDFTTNLHCQCMIRTPEIFRQLFLVIP